MNAGSFLSTEIKLSLAKLCVSFDFNFTLASALCVFVDLPHSNATQLARMLLAPDESSQSRLTLPTGAHTLNFTYKFCPVDEKVRQSCSRLVECSWNCRETLQESCVGQSSQRERAARAQAVLTQNLLLAARGGEHIRIERALLLSIASDNFLDLLRVRLHELPRHRTHKRHIARVSIASMTAYLVIGIVLHRGVRVLQRLLGFAGREVRFRSKSPQGTLKKRFQKKRCGEWKRSGAVRGPLTVGKALWRCWGRCREPEGEATSPVSWLLLTERGRDGAPQQALSQWT